ncbi:MAG: lipoyl(octanoyl) transferase LipB [Chitinophagales bacterium]
MVPIQLIDIGITPYKDAWELQEEYFNQIVSEKKNKGHMPGKAQKDFTNNYLIFCEHPHVITLGKSGKKEHLLLNDALLEKHKVDFFSINRGGDITYHGPEQIVAYPVINLDNFFSDIHKYMRNLEEVIIRVLDEYGIEGERIEGATGVWLDKDNPAKCRKICAMGVRTSRWVAMHGLALNVNNDLSFFDFIIPCGISDKKVSSLKQELGRTIDKAEVKAKILKHFGTIFNAEFVRISINA